MAEIPRHEIPEHVLDAAGVWVERCARGLSDSEELEFTAWLGEDPVRLAALAHAEQTWTDTEGLDRQSVGLGPTLARAPFHLRRGPRIAAGVGLVAALGLISFSMWPRLSDWSAVSPANAELLSTHVGEIRRVALNENTNLTLDTASVVETSGTKEDLHLVLKRGRARFTAQGRSIAPLHLTLGPWTVSADEAVFDADLIAKTPRIQVKEGVVRVKRPSAADTTVRSGEAISMEKSTVGPIPAAIDDWPSGILMLRETPISEAVAAINRYNDRRVVLVDPAIGVMRMSGGFQVRDPVGFARAVAALYHLRVDESDPASIRLTLP